MDLKVSSAKITGNPQKGSWSQVHDFFPEDVEKLKLRGRLIAVISAQSEDESIDSLSAGREILARLHEEYFGRLDLSAFNALKEAVDKVFGEFKNTFNDLQIAATSIVEEVVYSATCGGAQAMIFRNNMLASILASKREETVAASGYPKEDDIFIIGTSAFFNTFADGVIKANLEAKDIAKAAETFTLTVHAQGNTANLAAAIITFSRKEELQELVKQETKEDLMDKKEKKESQIGKFLERSIKNISNYLPGRKIFIKRSVTDLDSLKQKKNTLSVGIILIILLIVSVSFGIYQKKQKEKKETYQERLTAAIHSFEEAKNLASLNPSRARELFVESKTLVEGMINEGVKDDSLFSLKEEIIKSEGEILGEYNLEAQLFLDLSLLSDNFHISKLVADTQSLLALDKEARKLIKVEIETKKAEVIAGPDELKNPLEIAQYGERSYVLNQEGIYEVNEKLEEKSKNDVGENILFYAYAGNLYLADRETSKIFRYPAVATGFANKQEWLAGSVEVDLKESINLTIDGAVYLGFPQGKILKFSLGSPQEFSLTGIFPKIEALDSIYTNEEEEYLYILDSQNKRIIVVNKKGEFKAQYLHEKLKEANYTIASENEKKIIFSVYNGQLYSIEIKHIE